MIKNHFGKKKYLHYQNLYQELYANGFHRLWTDTPDTPKVIKTKLKKEYVQSS